MLNGGRLKDERGGVLVLAAVMIPVFLLLTALVLDVGNWFAHGRQLQNRADAGALAAGYELSRSWPACITDTAKEDAITAAARRYGGDPADATAVNTEVADQSQFNVQVNATSYAGPDHTDGASGPCQVHPATPGTENESNITPGGGTWIDVKVREQNTQSFAGAFGINLLQNRARARVELLEASEGDQFLPLAVPDTGIVKARIRFINECNGDVLASSDLARLHTANQTASGMTLWGPDPSGTATSVSPGTMSIAAPATMSGCAPMANNLSDYLPIGVELRVAGRPEIDLSDAVSCTTLAQSTTSADCFRRISQIRVYPDSGGLMGDRPQIRDVVLSPSGTDPCSLDPHYARLGVGASECTFDASVFMDWGARPGPLSAFSATIEVDGNPARALTGTIPQSTWTAAGVRVDSVGVNANGADDVVVSWEWDYKGPGTWEGDDCSNGSGCHQEGNTRVHQVNLADDPSGDEDSPSEGVSAVKLTSGPLITSTEIHSATLGTPLLPFVTVGTRSPFAPGQWAVLRLRSGQLNFSVVCDPYWDQPSSVDSMAAFYYGCQPPYANNDTTTTSFWWNGSSCPAPSSWFSYSGTPPNVSYPHQPWRCLQLDVGGNGFSVGDGMALATENCANPNIDPMGPGSKASCGTGGPNAYQCNHGINYNGGTNYPDAATDPRVVKLFVVPYGAYKNVSTGNGQVVPVLQLAAFYVTAWNFNKGDDPCDDPGDGGGLFGNDNDRLGPEQIGGYFIKSVETSGPVDPTAHCDPNDVTICRVVLTR